MCDSGLFHGVQVTHGRWGAALGVLGTVNLPMGVQHDLYEQVRAAGRYFRQERAGKRSRQASFAAYNVTFRGLSNILDSASDDKS